MNPIQLLKFALHGLWRQKVRTSLTLVGVAVGTCALAFSLALGIGLREFIETEFKGRDDFWRVLVRVDEPPPDESKIPVKDREKIEVQLPMAEDRKARIREALIDVRLTNTPRKPAKPLTTEVLSDIAKLPDVSEVRVFRTGEGWLTAEGHNERPRAFTVAGPLEDLRPRLIAGRLPASPDADEVVISELVLYQLGQFGVRDDANLEQVLGKTVTLEVGGGNDEVMLANALMGRKLPDKPNVAQYRALKKIREKFPLAINAFGLTDDEKAELLKLITNASAADEEEDNSSRTETRTYRVCGVVRLIPREERKKLTPLDSWELQQGHAFLPPGTGERHFSRLPWVKGRGFMSADVRVRPGGDLPGTVKAVEDMGYRTHSGAKWFAAAKREVTLIAAGLNLFAFIALFVASIGITNTLVTSVIERTKEIGILRAVGATRGQVMSIFLAEGAVIGLAGGAAGLALSRALAAWADDWVMGLIAGQMEGMKMLTTTIFVFPWWLWAGAVAFAVGVTTLAALYPARRAAKIHPIEALAYG
jgi:putative ABC transport system permease protein